jgi:hypothetical protein
MSSTFSLNIAGNLASAASTFATSCNGTAALALAHDLARHPEEMGASAMEALQERLAGWHDAFASGRSDGVDIAGELASLLEGHLSKRQWSSLSPKLLDEAQRRDATLAKVATASRHLVAQRGKGCEDTVEDFARDKILYRHSGVPDWIRLAIQGPAHERLPTDRADTICVKAATVFRHYTDEDAARAILSADELIPGEKPFVDRFDEEFRYVKDAGYPLLVGAFVTRPRYKPLAVGVMDYAYVDLLLHSGTVLLKVSSAPRRDWCYLLPGRPTRPRSRIPILAIGTGIDESAMPRWERAERRAQKKMSSML